MFKTRIEHNLILNFPFPSTAEQEICASSEEPDTFLESQLEEERGDDKREMEELKN